MRYFGALGKGCLVGFRVFGSVKVLGRSFNMSFECRTALYEAFRTLLQASYGSIQAFGYEAPRKPSENIKINNQKHSMNTL